MISVMRFGVLGPLQVTDSEGRELALGGRRQRSVLALLLLHAGAVMSNERLIDELWGEHTPASARKTLQTYVMRLRKALGDQLLVTRPGGYMLRTQGAQIDLERFESLAAAGRRALTGGEPDKAAELLGEALRLWRGPPLADFTYEPFAQPEIARLGESRMAALEDRIDADLALGHHAALVGELEALVREHPLRERLRAQLMLALYRDGRQADALDVYQRTRDHLTGELGLEPGAALRSLQQAILNQDPSLSAAATLVGATPAEPHSERLLRLADRRPGDIPRGVKVIGRERELAELGELLADPEVSLVTLTGTGGIGKTTLGLEAARASASRFADGVALVCLASIVSRQQVLPELARVLGIELSAEEPELDTITRILGTQERLLVLDNFEHVVEAAPAIGRLAAECPRLKLLVTSRTPLRVALEQVYAVSALTVSSGNGAHLVGDAGLPAAEMLFIERAAAADPAFTATDSEAGAISELCRYLGGLPLALELAAARTAVLSPTAILERLRSADESLGPARRDAPARQRTLRATIDWSFQLIAPTEQTVFTTLAAFTSGFTVESAEAVCDTAGESVADALAALLDHGLLHRVPARRGFRLGMLEPIRRYALDRLRADPRYEDVIIRHVEHLAGFASQAQAGLESDSQLEWLDRVDDEQANLRAVLHGANSEPQLDGALRIAGALTRYWHVRDLACELATWLTTALAEPAGNRTVRAQALHALGRSALHVGKRQEAVQALEECVTISEELGDSRLVAASESLLAALTFTERRLTEAASHRERALAWLATVENAATRASVLMNVAGCTEDGHQDGRSRYLDERRLTLEAVAVYESAGDLLGLPYARSNLGWAAWLAGDLELARENLERALVEAETISVAGLRAVIQANLGLLELVEGQDTAAGTHLNAAIEVLTQIGQVACAREAIVGLAAISARRGATEESARLLRAAQLIHGGPPGRGERLLRERYLGGVAAEESNGVKGRRPGGRTTDHQVIAGGLIG
jgi:predicted ATPase/DNA-binding SARP family transcriptional activator